MDGTYIVYFFFWMHITRRATDYRHAIRLPMLLLLLLGIWFTAAAILLTLNEMAEL